MPSSATAVTVTANEVAHARNGLVTDLVVVDRIHWRRTRAGEYSTSTLRVAECWSPANEDLFATDFRYALSDDYLQPVTLDSD